MKDPTAERATKTASPDRPLVNRAECETVEDERSEDGTFQAWLNQMAAAPVIVESR